MATRISIVSRKGGVGTTLTANLGTTLTANLGTTLTANLGAMLADLGKRVLLVDADIQPTLSSYYRLASQAPRGLVDVLETGDLTDGINVTTVGCDVLISNDPAGQLPDWILHTPDGRFRLKHLLKRIETYEFILIDTQGAAGPLQDMAVLAADLRSRPSRQSFSRHASLPGEPIAWTARRMRAPPLKRCGPCATGPRSGGS